VSVRFHIGFCIWVRLRFCEGNISNIVKVRISVRVLVRVQFLFG